MWVVIHIKQVDSEHTELNCIGDFPEQWEANKLADSLRLLASDDLFVVSIVDDPLRYISYLVKKAHDVESK